MLKRLIAALIVLLSLGEISAAQAPASDAARAYRSRNERALLRSYSELLAIPNVAFDKENINRNARFIFDELKRRGLAPQLLKAKEPGVPPVVFGEYKAPGAVKTIVFYAHYDGQPTDAADWTGSGPWVPVLRSAAIENGGEIIDMPAAGGKIDPEWRIYARSASDDKAGVFTILTAFDALKQAGIEPSVNLKFFFEGEEEAGSGNLREILDANRDLLRSDGWIICDGPVHQSGRKLVSFGVRGVTSVDLTVYGANRDLHSGHYGNWAPNPGFLLVKLLETMKDDSGRVLIKDWYRDVEPLGEAELEAIRNAPRNDDELKRELGIVWTEGFGSSLLELLMEPSLNINGMKSGDVGAMARNVIPSTANAVLGIRLVKGNDVKSQVLRLKLHIISQGYYLIDRDPTPEERLKHKLIAKLVPEEGGYNAQRTAMDLPISRAIIAAVRDARGELPVTLPTMGGSLPLSIITETLEDPPLVTVPIANHDNNQHAANENIRIGNLWDGIEMYANLMTMRIDN